ncbi:HDOD domain-containing protein [Gemmata sp. JC673]|uniref:HDOD domain-containing protein n=1 Tax=Gemmata algarum TaxID=2975278 RepID=A0ABU5F7Y9_9BACT|nr:HDOD domain-containing protein [Gemmata algarum]MDY3563314.1 HDOD domain-containing protein [Gemmata algarum]
MSRRVLVVTDDPAVRRALRDTFAPLVAEWEATFASGAEAVKHLLGARPDALVLDAHLADNRAAELLTEGRRRNPSMARVVLAAPGRTEVIGLVTLAHRVLSRQCLPDELVGAIQRAHSLRELLNSPSLAALVGRLTTVPALSAVYTRISEELAFPDFSLATVGGLVAQDLGISAKLLQMANSALVGLRRPASTPSQAVRILGADLTRTLVLAVDLFSHYNPYALRPFSIEALWEHSQAVAELGAAIAAAERAEERVVRESALAGLFLDIGRLTLASQLTGPYKEILALMRHQHLGVVAAETQVLGTSHAEVGAYLLGLWGLPDGLVEAVAWHHQPSGCPGTGFTPLTAVHAADAILLEDEGAEPDWAYLGRLGLRDRYLEWKRLARQRTQVQAS